jgi:hypothetical protein
MEAYELYTYLWQLKEEFEDTKGVIRVHISKTSRQHNSQKKKYKRIHNDLQNIHTKLIIVRENGIKNEQHRDTDNIVHTD